LVYTSADSNKLIRIDFADFLRTDSFPELIHIGLPDFFLYKMQLSCEERNRIKSLDSILNLTNLQINYNNPVEYGNVSVFKALNFFWARNKVLNRLRILSQSCNFASF
jgi:hypothetical protein